MRRSLIALLLILTLLLPAAQAEQLPLSVDGCAVMPGQEAELRYYLPERCAATLAVRQDGQEVLTVFSQRVLLPGQHVLKLEAGFFDLPEGEYTLVLSADGAEASAVLRIGAAKEEAPTESAPAEAAAVTPALRSAYHPGHTACYWCTPMDITDEAAVWAMLTAPVTVVDIGQKEQLIVRAAPSNDSEGIAVVTGASQAVHVLETRDDGWALVELYSSSFHDSKVKNWNAFVTGYLPAGKLKTREVNQTYGMVLDKLSQKLYIFKEGHLFTTLLASTGLYNERQPYNETRSGEFIIISRVGDFKSDNLVCGMGLRFNSGDLLHEVPHTVNADGSKNYKNCEPKLGSRASHGCVRIQRRKNADGINMAWIWNNIKVGTKLVIWEDYQGRQLPLPDPGLTLYYNPNGGSNYHAVADCGGVKDQYLPLTPFSYGELETGVFAKLTPCAYCTPEKRLSEIEQINREHLLSSPGEIMTLMEGK